jgi:hypothetical protein
VASQLYPKGGAHLLGRATKVDLLVDTIKIMFYAGAFTATDEFVSDLTGASIVARSGALAGKTITPGALIGATFDANDITLTAVTGAAFGLVLAYKDNGGVDASSPLLAKFEVATFTPNGGDVNVVFNASGLWQI